MTTEFGANPTLRSYLVVLQRRKWWVIWAALLGLAVSLALSLTQAKQYSATAQLLIQPFGQGSAAGTSQQPITPTDVQTEVQLVTSAPVQQAVQRQLGSHPAVSTSQVAQTNVISVTAIAASPSRAARVANTYAKAFVSYQRAIASTNLTAAEAELRSQIISTGAEIKARQTTKGFSAEVTALLNQEAVLRDQLAQLEVVGAAAGGGAATGGVELVTPALGPAAPSSPKPVQDAVLGLLAGLLLGLGAAFLRHSLDEAVTSKDAAEHLGGAPVLGLVPMVTSWKKRSQAAVVSTSRPTSSAAESYRSLRTSLQFARQGQDLRIILVTSPASSEGKTSTLANLGVVFAQAGERVVLVSGDLRRPRIGQFFGIGEEAGLTTVLLSGEPLKQVLQQVDGHERLWVLPCGPVPPNPAELLSGPEAQAVFAALGQDFDLVLIDSPPVLPVTDAMVLSSYADGTLLVVAAGQTRRADLQRASEKFSQASAPLLGIVLNQVTRQTGYASQYESIYDYGPPVASVPATNGRPHSNGESAPPTAATRHSRRRQ